MEQQQVTFKYDFNALENGHIVLAQHFCSGQAKIRPFVIIYNTNNKFKFREYTAVPLFSDLENHIVRETRYELVVNKSATNRLKINGYAKCHQVQTLCQQNIIGVIGKIEHNVLHDMQSLFNEYCNYNN